MTNLLNVIFENSILGKLYKFYVKIYSKSFTKKIVNCICNIYFFSKFKKRQYAYLNSVPKYKYSIVRKICEAIFNFIIKYSKKLEEFSKFTILNSKTYNFILNVVKQNKGNSFKCCCCFLFFVSTGFLIGITIMKGFSIFTLISFLFATIMLVLFSLCDFLRKTWENSCLNRLLTYLFKLEV